MTQIEDKVHARLSPSGWDRWSACPGSVVLEEGQVENPSRYAAEGTVAHEIADRVLRGEVGDAEDLIGQKFSAGGFDFVVDMEMADAVNAYVSHVHVLIDTDKGDILYPEQSVPIGHLTGESGAAGTSDCIGITNGGTRLVVIDLKYGKGVRVDAEGNGQGRMYALGALERFGFVFEDIAEVEIVIVQPRLDHVTGEILTVEELRAHADEITMAAGRVELARNDVRDGLPISDPEYALRNLNPGEKQCKFCKAKAVCPALRAEVSGAMQTVSAAEPHEFPDLTLPKQAASMVIDSETDAERLASFLRAVPLIEDAIKAVRGEVERRLFAGDTVPGFKLVEGKKGNRGWSDEKAAEAELKKRFKSDEMYEKKLISLPKAEKLLRDKPRIWAKVVEAAGIAQSEGKPSVAPESDPRPAYEVAAAPEDFPDLAGRDAEVQALLD